jgi:hypothetical protein
MGGVAKPTSTTNTSQNQSATNTPPAWVNADYQNLVAQAQGVASTPYQAYTGQLVAPINAQQQSGIGTINTAATSELPYNAAAAGLAGASAQQINPSALNSAAIGQYLSPYQSDVINATQAELSNANAQQAASLASNAAGSGALGGDRSGVAQAQLAGQQDIANNATIASLNNQNYAQALATATGQQEIGLSAAQNTAAREAAAAGQFGALGANAVSEGVAGGEAQANAGTLEQQTQQAQDTAAYNQYMQKLAYPFQTTGWLSNIIQGIGSESGGTSTGFNTGQQQAFNTSPFTTLAGGLLGLGALYGHYLGGRVKRGDGGGLGGAVLANGPLMPGYSDPAMFGGAASPITGSQGLGGGSFIPPINLPLGHTMPTLQQGTPSSGGSSGAGGGSASTAGLGPTGTLLQSLGKGLANTPLADTIQDTIQDLPDNFSRGGVARARHFDSGGDVNPLEQAANSVLANNLFASAANGNLTAQESGGLGDQNQNVASLPPGPPPAPQGAPPAQAPLPMEQTPPGTVQLASAAPGLGAARAPDQDPMRPYRDAISSIESAGSGGYDAIGPLTKHGDRPYGRYGVMGANIPQWTNQILGTQMTPNQFLADHGAQDAVFNSQFGSYLKSTGSPQDAASMWFTGLPLAQGMARHDNNITDATYVNKFQHALNGDTPPPLAFDNTNSTEGGSPGQQAIATALNSANTGLGALAPPPDGGGSLGWLDRALGGTGRHSAGIFGIDMPDSVRALMLQTAAGMMGAKTQNPFQAFGQGLESGIAGTRAMALQNAQVGLLGARTVQELSTAQISQMRLKGMFDALNQMQNEGQQVANSAEAGASRQRPITSMIAPTGAPQPGQAALPVGGAGAPAVPPAGGAAGIPGVPAGGTSPSPQPSSQPSPSPAPSGAQPQIPNSNWPPWLHSMANKLRFTWPEQATALDARADHIETTGITNDVTGNLVQIPGYATLNQQVTAQHKSAELGATAPYDLVTVVGPDGTQRLVPKSTVLATPGGMPASLPVGTEEDIKALRTQDQKVASAAPQISQQLQRLDRIGKIMETYQTGTFAEEKANVIGALRSVLPPGVKIPSTATANPAAFQEFLKDTIANAMTGVQQVGGGRILLAEIQAFTKATAQANLQPGANSQIIAQASGILNQTKDYNTAYLNWRKANPMASRTDAGIFENDWYDKNPIQENYVNPYLKNMAYRGQIVPSAKNGIPPINGQAYEMENGGIYRWNGNQYQFERRAGE